ncbi:hypothetical protein ACOSQ2_016765 [Xanthoceras sorbifolium]
MAYHLEPIVKVHNHSWKWVSWEIEITIGAFGEYKESHFTCHFSEGSLWRSDTIRKCKVVYVEEKI